MSYTYDADNELTSDGVASYSYDANGNRTMTGYTIGTGNQLLNDGTFTYTYDADGNMTEKSKGTRPADLVLHLRQRRSLAHGQ